jgi:hypothetical protein
VEKRLSSVLLRSYVGRIRLKVLSMQVVPLQVAEMKTLRKFVKSPSKIDEVPETVGRLGVWYGTCRGIREDLNTRQISAGLVLRLFID